MPTENRRFFSPSAATRFRLALAAVVVLSLAFVFYGLWHKEILHLDEQWSYAHANSTQGAFLHPAIDSFWHNISSLLYERWFDGKIFHDYLTVRPEEAFRYGHIWQNLANDVHPPLYFTLLHTLCSFAPGTFSPLPAAVINLAAWVLSLLMLARLAREFLPRWETLAAVALYALSPLGLETALFFRMYALQTLFATGLLYETVILLKENRPSCKRLTFIFIWSALGILTHYASIFISFFVTLFAGMVLVRRQKWILLGCYAAAMMYSFLLLFVVFPPALDVLSGSLRGQQGLHALSTMSPSVLLLRLDEDVRRLGSIYLYKMLTLTALPLRSLFFAAVFYFAAAANKKLPADTRLRLLAAWTAACGLFICMVTPDMQAFDSRYFAVFGPALSIISIAFLHRFCLMSGISAAKIPLFVGAAVLLNAALAVANLKNTPQLYGRTPDNAAFYESVRQKNLFAVIPQNKWQLFNLSTTAMHAGKIYATSAPCPQNLPPQADMVLVQNSYYQPGKTTLPPPVPLCPELAQKLQHRGTVNIAWTYYDWYLPRPPQFLRH